MVGAIKELLRAVRNIECCISGVLHLCQCSRLTFSEAKYLIVLCLQRYLLLVGCWRNGKSAQTVKKYSMGKRYCGICSMTSYFFVFRSQKMSFRMY